MYGLVKFSTLSIPLRKIDHSAFKWSEMLKK